MPDKPICLQKKIVAQSRLFKIEQQHLQFSNGEQRYFECINSYGTGVGGVMIVAISNQNNLLLIKEYGASIGDYELSFPKGFLKENESLIEGANRELQEEVKMGAKELHWLRTMTLSPSYFAASTQLVVARDLFPSALAGDEPEPLEVLEWPLAKAELLLDRADFSEARSIAALLLVKKWLKGTLK